MNTDIHQLKMLSGSVPQINLAMNQTGSFKKTRDFAFSNTKLTYNRVKYYFVKLR